MNKVKRIIKYILVLLLIVTPFHLTLVKADSGWDSSYDSGGGSYDSGGSSWSSSDYDYDYDYSSSSGSSSMDFETFVFFLIIIVIIILISTLSNKNKGSISTGPNYINQYQDVSEEQVKTLLPDMSLAQLRTMAYEKFIAIQNAWTEFDYDKIRELCTDELYNSYISQLDVLKIKNGKNIMSDFVVNGTKIIDVSETDGNVSVTVFMNVSFYDYVINTSTNEVTRGNSNIKITNNYVMTFVRSQSVKDGKIVCPNCGAANEIVTSGKCEYCGSTLVANANDFVLSKKTNVNK